MAPGLAFHVGLPWHAAAVACCAYCSIHLCDRADSGANNLAKQFGIRPATAAYIRRGPSLKRDRTSVHIADFAVDLVNTMAHPASDCQASPLPWSLA